MVQFTGLYCDKTVSSALFYELMFYSPIAALVLVMLFVLCCFSHVEGLRKEKTMALEKHLPRGSRAVDMKKNFPEMFLTHEQYAELAFAIQQQGSLEGSLKDKSVPASPEKAANRAKSNQKLKGHRAQLLPEKGRLVLHPANHRLSGHKERSWIHKKTNPDLLRRSLNIAKSTERGKETKFTYHTLVFLHPVSFL